MSPATVDPEAGLPDLTARLRRLEDSAELGDLVARYCNAVDDRDIEALCELFLPNGSFGHEKGPQVSGRDAIRSHYLDRLAGITYSFHHPHTQLLTSIRDDEAAGVVTAHAEMGRPGAAPIRAAMRYHDAYRRHQGRWHFARRHLRFWYLAPADDIDAGRLGDLRIAWPGEPKPADLPETVPSFIAFQNEVTKLRSNRRA